MPVEGNSARYNSRFAVAILWVLFIGVDGAAQLLFKNAAVHLPEPSASAAWVYAAATSVRVWMALACLGVAFVLWMMILRRFPLATAFPMTASTYVVVVTASQILFGERITLVQCLGIALIVVGIAMLRPAH